MSRGYRDPEPVEPFETRPSDRLYHAYRKALDDVLDDSPPRDLFVRRYRVLGAILAMVEIEQVREHENARDFDSILGAFADARRRS